jgi:hypothetical protein
MSVVFQWHPRTPLPTIKIEYHWNIKETTIIQTLNLVKKKQKKPQIIGQNKIISQVTPDILNVSALKTMLREQRNNSIESPECSQVVDKFYVKYGCTE